MILVRSKIALAFGALVLCTQLLIPFNCAEGQSNSILPQTDLVRQLKDTGALIREYASKHDHFPSSVSEIDEFLMQAYKQVNLTVPDSRVQIASNGKYRTFYQFAMAVDPSFKGIPIVNGVPKVPESYVAPASTIVLLSDGQDEMVAWAASETGKPASQDGNSPLFVYEQIEKKEPGNSSEKDSK